MTSEKILGDKEKLYSLLEESLELAESYRIERNVRVEEDLKSCLLEIASLLEEYKSEFPQSVRPYFDAFLEEDLDIQDRLSALSQVLQFIGFDFTNKVFSGFSQSENLRRWIRFFHDSREEEEERERDLLLRGVGVGSGQVTGRVFVIQSNQDYLNIPENSVVVARTTRPDLIISIEKVSAIITDIGGKLCHASIIARQMGLPCVVNCATATDILENGMWVTVDADQGQICKARGNIHFS